MPLVYLGTGWFIGIALASELHLPIELLLPAFLIPIIGLALWKDNHRAGIRHVQLRRLSRAAGREQAGAR
jgi:hypothetical protein